MVAEHLNLAVLAALAQMPERHEKWVGISHIVGRFRIPSLLGADVQRMGRLDIILCALESNGSFPGSEKYLFVFDLFSSLSDLWVRSAYSTLYAIPEGNRSDRVKALLYDVDRLRTSIEKYQIPKDWNIVQGPDGNRSLELYTADGMHSHTYDVGDPRRATISPRGIAEDGSNCWQIIDLSQSQSRWLSRRSLADRYLTLFEQSESGLIDKG